MNDRFVFLTCAAVVAGALSAPALAQNVPQQFVVTGRAADAIQDFTTINLATAERIAESCEAVATSESDRISITVLDKGGVPVYRDRMDGQGHVAIVTSEMKARTALLNREPSKALMNRMLESPSEELQTIEIGLYPNAGGLPVVVNKQMIGAVGVGGSPPRLPGWSDEICAHKGMIQVLGPSVPPLLADNAEYAQRSPQGRAPVPRFGGNAAPKSSLAPEFVVSGKAAAMISDGNQISLAAAKKVARACRDWAASQGRAMSLYIIDTSTEVVHMERTDGQNSRDVRTALLKAETALKTRQPTSLLAAQIKNDSRNNIRDVRSFQFYTEPGGVPIVVAGQMIGAMGVSGTGDESDEKCAIEGLTATFANEAALPVYGAPAPVPAPTSTPAR